MQVPATPRARHTLPLAPDSSGKTVRPHIGRLDEAKEMSRQTSFRTGSRREQTPRSGKCPTNHRKLRVRILYRTGNQSVRLVPAESRYVKRCPAARTRVSFYRSKTVPLRSLPEESGSERSGKESRTGILQTGAEKLRYRRQISRKSQNAHTSGVSQDSNGFEKSNISPSVSFSRAANGSR